MREKIKRREEGKKGKGERARKEEGRWMELRKGEEREEKEGAKKGNWAREGQEEECRRERRK